LNQRSRRDAVAARAILPEVAFQRMLSLEHNAGNGPAIVSAHASQARNAASGRDEGKSAGEILSVLASSTRETDVAGWYQEQSVAGVLFMEINLGRESSIPRTMLMRVRNTLRSQLSPQQFEELGITLQLLPESPGVEIPAPAVHGIVIPREPCESRRR